jgi:toxin FitB
VSYLLDACVLSDLASKRPSSQVVQWIDTIDPDRMYLSVVTVGEIQNGIEKLRDPGRKEALTAWLHEDLLIRFRDRLTVLDTHVLLAWGTLVGRLEAQGRPMPAIDSLLAASALHHRFVLVTRNEDDFRHAGVTLLNPWKATGT